MGVSISRHHQKEVASITQENQFPCAMIDEDTQIIFLDEWAERTLQSDVAKLVLQGAIWYQQSNTESQRFWTTDVHSI